MMQIILLKKLSKNPLKFDIKAIILQKRREEINGVNNSYFAGAYWRYGFHEDGLWSANTIAQELGCGL